MGDVLTLIEKAEAAVEEDEQAEMEARMRAGQFTLRRLPLSAEDAEEDGAAAGRAEDDPRASASSCKDVDIDERQLARVEAIVLSMTPQERRMPHLINGSRRARIAAGSGHDDPGGQQAPRRPQADGEDDEADGQGEDAATLVPAASSMTAQHRATGDKEARRMAVRMRLTRVGSKKNPIYRVVVADSRSPRDGGSSRSSGATTRRPTRRRSSSTRKIKDWLGKGAQPTDAVAKLIKAAGIERRLTWPSCSPGSRAASSTIPTPCASSEVEREDATVLQLHVAPDDVGKVIGRAGPDRARAAHGRARQRRAASAAGRARDR